MNEIKWKGEGRILIGSGMHPATQFGSYSVEQSYVTEEEAWEVLVAYLAIKHRCTSAVFFKEDIAIGKIEYICDLFKNESKPEIVGRTAAGVAPTTEQSASMGACGCGS